MIIVDIDGLSKILGNSKHAIMKIWEEIPHFFTGRGRNLKSARFDAEDVIRYLKNRDYQESHRVWKDKKTGKW